MRRILLPAAAITLALVPSAPGTAAVHTEGPMTGVAIAAAGDMAAGEPDPDGAVPGDTVPTVTANPFLPEERDLTDCLGLLQRPGCGSEARGGLGQTLVAIFMIGGLVLIFGRVAWGVRRNRQALPPAGPDAEEPADRRDDGPASFAGADDAVDDAADVAARGPTDAEPSDGAS